MKLPLKNFLNKNKKNSTRQNNKQKNPKNSTMKSTQFNKTEETNPKIKVKRTKRGDTFVIKKNSGPVTFKTINNIVYPSVGTELVLEQKEKKIQEQLDSFDDNTKE